MSFYSVIARVSQSSIAVKMGRHAVSNIGELGSAGCGPRRWRARTASARASSKSDLSPSTEASILDRGT